MTIAKLEHVNITVADSEAAAQILINIFGWHVRWRGDAMSGGHTVHVGTETDYIALWSPLPDTEPATGFLKSRPLNHIGIVVNDLDATEAKVIAAGLTPFNHADYDPGRRFYFYDGDGIEFEIVSYV